MYDFDFRIMRNGELLKTPYKLEDKEVLGKPRGKWQSSYVIYDTGSLLEIGPIYKVDNIHLCYNESLSHFAATPRRNPAALEINGVDSSTDGLYKTDTGHKIRSVCPFDLGAEAGLDGWTTLTDDCTYYLLFRTKKPAEAVEVDGKMYALTNNFCAVQDLATGIIRTFYTSNWVSKVEHSDGRLLFLSETTTTEGRRPFIFDENGIAHIYPKILAYGGYTVIWSTEKNCVAFISCPTIPEYPAKPIPPIKMIRWSYLSAKVDELEFESKPLAELAKRN